MRGKSWIHLRWCWLLALACAPLAGCNQSQPATTMTTPDAAVSCPRRECVPEGEEDCQACLEAMGRCCFDDYDWQGPPGTFDLLLAHCRESQGCMACCNECAAMSCKAMQVNHLCPWVDDKVRLP